MDWRERLRPASFRGVEFKVDASAKTGGRRGITFEFPKRDTPSDEDMGRRAHGWAISGWVIGDDHDEQADELEDALNEEGAGLLIHPTMGEMQVRCERYGRTERRQEGNMTSFDLLFVEVGSKAEDLFSEPTRANVEGRASDAGAASARSADANLQAGQSARRDT